MSLEISVSEISIYEENMHAMDIPYQNIRNQIKERKNMEEYEITEIYQEIDNNFQQLKQYCINRTTPGEMQNIFTKTLILMKKLTKSHAIVSFFRDYLIEFIIKIHPCLDSVDLHSLLYIFKSCEKHDSFYDMLHFLDISFSTGLLKSDTSLTIYEKFQIIESIIQREHSEHYDNDTIDLLTTNIIEYKQHEGYSHNLQNLIYSEQFYHILLIKRYSYDIQLQIYDGIGFLPHIIFHLIENSSNINIIDFINKVPISDSLGLFPWERNDSLTDQLLFETDRATFLNECIKKSLLELSEMETISYINSTKLAIYCNTDSLFKTLEKSINEKETLLTIELIEIFGKYHTSVFIDNSESFIDCIVDITKNNPYQITRKLGSIFIFLMYQIGPGFLIKDLVAGLNIIQAILHSNLRDCSTQYIIGALLNTIRNKTTLCELSEPVFDLVKYLWERSSEEIKEVDEIVDIKEEDLESIVEHCEAFLRGEMDGTRR